jgi:hypothetical protein
VLNDHCHRVTTQLQLIKYYYYYYIFLFAAQCFNTESMQKVFL